MFGSVTARSEKFQSTLPRGERQSSPEVTEREMEISIHAPTGGATRSGKQIYHHATDFNPRSHGGSDEDLAEYIAKPIEISIHAPTGGATGISGHFIQRAKNFNPRSHGGSDLEQATKKLKDMISIHAPTGGAT